jgi:formate hydrogenlyase subunit 6/NADH:ubiquinone oxidoreductase subunit I
MKYPDGPPPELPERFVGMPALDASQCGPGCQACVDVCPTDAVTRREEPASLAIDLGRCLFCRECEKQCPGRAIRFTRGYQLAATRREDLVASGDGRHPVAVACSEEIRRLFGRSLALRQVSAGGCNACEADTNVLGTVGWDLGRFGIQFVASPRHADGLLITGPVTENMRLAVEKTYAAVHRPSRSPQRSGRGGAGRSVRARLPAPSVDDPRWVVAVLAARLIARNPRDSSGWIIHGAMEARSAGEETLDALPRLRFLMLRQQC